MARAKKILRIAADTAAALMVVLAAVISVTALTAKSNDGIPELFGYTPFSVMTDSMKTTVNPGDYILVEKCVPSQLKKDDIISYYTIMDGERRINTHRIAEVVREDGSLYFITRGDNREVCKENDDLPVYPGDVIGRYNHKRVALLGYVMNFLETKWGFFCCLLLPILLFTVYRIYRLIAVFIHNKKAALLEEVGGSVPDEVRDSIIARYLAEKESTE